MTRPTVIYFGRDTSPARELPPPPKIYLRTLLFATSKRGRVIESMHVRLTRNEMHRNSTSGCMAMRRWSEGAASSSGRWASLRTITSSRPGMLVSFDSPQGQYRIEVFAHLLGDSHRTLLFAQTFDRSTRLRTHNLSVLVQPPPFSLRLPHRVLSFDDDMPIFRHQHGSVLKLADSH